MAFLERLRGYLERVEREPEGLPVIRVDVAAHRRHFAEASDRADKAREERLARLQTMSTWGEHEEQQRLAEQIWREERQQIEKLREALPAFLEEVADQILETLAPNASPEELTKLINVAINW